MVISLINFIILIISFVIMGYTYIISIQPMKRTEKKGERAWKECKTYRSIGGVFEFVSVINMIIWIWYPLPIVGEWKINEDIWVGIIIGLAILIPGLFLVIKGVMDAGSETLSPSKDTKMYGGIYKYIRHPQTLGEFPMFVAISFMLNSWFLVVLSAVYIIVYIPIMMYFEEKDLTRRFGDKYLEYKKQTGALFPKISNSKQSKMRDEGV